MMRKAVGPIRYESGIIRSSKYSDAKRLSKRIRGADLRELQALRGVDVRPVDVLREGIALSDPCFTLLTKDSFKVAAMFGTTPSEATPYTGNVWMLGSDYIATIGRAFAKHSSTWVDHLFGERYKVLQNVADARNAVHIRWLRWLKFTVGREPIFINDVPFLPFYKLRPDILNTS